MKKNVKVAKELIALAKEIAANNYEDKISPERLKKVWWELMNREHADIIERIKLFVQYRDAIAHNLPTVQTLRDQLGNALDKLMQGVANSDEKIEKFLDKLKNNPTLLGEFNFTVRGNTTEGKAFVQKYGKIFADETNSYAQLLQTGIMEEFFVIDQAIQLMNLVSANTLRKNELITYLGFGQNKTLTNIFNYLVDGVAPDFLTEMDTVNYIVKMQDRQRNSLTTLNDFMKRKEDEFQQNQVKDHKVRIEETIVRLKLGEKNSLLLISKLKGKIAYFNEVLAAVSFTNASFDKALGQNFESNQGIWIPSASGGKFKASVKTAGIVDTIKNAVIGAFKGLSNAINKLKDLFSKKEEYDTKKEAEEIIGALDFQVK